MKHKSCLMPNDFFLFLSFSFFLSKNWIHTNVVTGRPKSNSNRSGGRGEELRETHRCTLQKLL